MVPDKVWNDQSSKEINALGLFSCLLVAGCACARMTSVKPIGYFKANAAQVLTKLAEQREPMLITQKV